MNGINAGHPHTHGPDTFRRHDGHRVDAGDHDTRQHGAQRRARQLRHDMKPDVEKGSKPTEHARGARLFHRAAKQGLQQRFAPSLAISKSVSFYTTDPTEARDVAQSLLQAVNALLARANSDSGTVATEISNSLAQARAEASELAATDAEAEGIEAAAAMLDDGLQDDVEAEQSLTTDTDILLALKASRSQKYSLKIRTQEGDIVKIALRTEEFLSIAGGGQDNETSEEIALSANARLKLRVHGDLSDTELDAIRGVFDQAADIAQKFFDGDLAAALDSARMIEFDDAQIAKIRLNFSAATSVNALYSRVAPAVIEAPVVEQTPLPAAQASATPDSDAAAISTDSSTPVNDTMAPAEADVANPLDEIVDAIAAYLSAFVTGLEGLQAGMSEDEQSGVRLVNAFKLDVLKLTLIASADDEQADIAHQAGEAIENAATRKP